MAEFNLVVENAACSEALSTRYLFFVYPSLALHPNNEIIASGQVAGHAKKEGKVKPC